jgi:hypothetical protein
LLVLCNNFTSAKHHPGAFFSSCSNCSFDADELAVRGENNDFPYDIADHVENQNGSSQEEEDEPEASYDDEEIKGTKKFSQDDFWLTTPNFIASELFFFQRLD